jgi:hypothetical protein
MKLPALGKGLALVNTVTNLRLQLKAGNVLASWATVSFSRMTAFWAVRWLKLFMFLQSIPRLLYNGYRVSFPGVKRPGRGVDHPPSSSAEVKERVELYLYSPSGPSWPVLGRTLPLPLPSVHTTFTELHGVVFLLNSIVYVTGAR